MPDSMHWKMANNSIEPRSPARQRLSAAQRRETILDAALDVFAEYGFEGGRLRQIAAKAGITEPYLFRHFSSKSELYEWAVIRPLIALVERFESELAAITSGPRVTVADLIRGINRVLLQFMLDAVPYIGVSLFSDTADDTNFYAREAQPRVVDPHGPAGPHQGMAGTNSEFEIGCRVDGRHQLRCGT